MASAAVADETPTPRADDSLVRETWRHLAARMPPLSRPSPPQPPVDELLAELERKLGLERVALRRVRPGEWEVVTMSGETGRGDSLAEAIEHLLSYL